MSLEYTKIVRKVMRKHFKYSPTIYTNKYENCRTVKCYAGEKKNKKLMRKIDEALAAAGSTGHSVKKFAFSSWYGNSQSIIVRLPN